MRLLRALLYLYPASFRAEYSDQLCAVYEESRREARGPLPAARLWLAAAIDTVASAVLAHIDLLRQDLRYTLRTLRQAPGFAVTVVVVTALGVGANTAVFTLTDHVLIRPLPFFEPDRLVMLWEKKPGYDEMELSPPNYRDWKNASTSFETMGAFRPLSVNLVGRGEPQRLEGATVTAELLPMLGVPPRLGRWFSPQEDEPGAAGAALLSDTLWQSSFGADPTVVGETILLDNVRYTVIGVMPPSFQFPNPQCRIWTALRLDGRAYEDRSNNSLRVVARRKPGVSLDEARQEMSVIAARLERAYPNENEKTGATVKNLRDEIADQARLLLIALFGAAVCLLLIACSNLANLLLARGMARQKELAVRTALGAGRERLIRQMLTESIVLAMLGGTAGIAVATAGLPLLLRMVPQNLPIAEPSIDWRVLVFTFVITVITGLFFGIVPAFQACRDVSHGGLREGSRGGVGGRKERLRSALVVVEIAVSVVLLVSAGLLLRALWRLQMVDPGFRTDNVLTLRTALPTPQYDSVAARTRFYERVLSGVRALPGVENAGFISYLPIRHGGGIWPVNVDGRTASRAMADSASLRFVTPGFFRTLGISLVRGRYLSEADTSDTQFVAVVSESFVRRYWPDQDPIGRSFEFGFDKRTIVGVVRDIRVRGLDRSSEPQVYLPAPQVKDGWLTWYSPKDLVVHSAGDPMSLVPAIRQIIRETDPTQPISDVQTMAAIVDESIESREVQMKVLGIFAALAFLLAGVGIHGLLSFSVSNRTQEIGVRMALGAGSRNILSMVLRESAVLAGIGVAAGVALAYAAARLLESALAGVTPGDLTTFATVAGLAAGMTLLGSFLPAIRAVRVDPATAIRTE